MSIESETESARPGSPGNSDRPLSSARGAGPGLADGELSRIDDGFAHMVEVARSRAREAPGQMGFCFLPNEQSAGEVLTYGDLDRAASAVAGRLRSQFKKGERALLFYPPGIDFVVAFYGCLYAGIVAVPVLPPRQNRSFARVGAIAADCGAKVILSTLEFAERLKAFTDPLAIIGALPWLITDERESEGPFTPDDVVADDLAFLQYTSGSTAMPKGVMVRHRHLMANLKMIEAAFGIVPSDRTLSWLPIHHDMGLIGKVLQPLYTGTPVWHMAPARFLVRPVRWLEVVSQMGITFTGAPNFAYEHCVQKTTAEQKAEMDLSSWRLAFNGAEPVRPEIMRAFAEAFCDCGFRHQSFYPCYGLAEAVLFVTGGDHLLPPVERYFDRTNLEQGLAREVSADAKGVALSGTGRAFEDLELRIVDPKSRQILTQDGSVGEIWVTGSNVAEAYWGRPETSEHDLRARTADGGFGPALRTGDLGFVWKGELFVTGRIKDLIVIRGRNLYPQDLEFLSSGAHPACQAHGAAAFAWEENGREKLVILQEIHRTYRNHLDGDAVIRAIQESVAYSCDVQADYLLLVKHSSLPKTTSGKIRRGECRRLFQADELMALATHEGPVIQNMNTDNTTAAKEPAKGYQDEARAIKRLLELIEEHSPRRGKVRVRITDKFYSDLGYDSLSAVGLAAGIESNFGVPATKLLTIDTVAQMVDLIVYGKEADSPALRP